MRGRRGGNQDIEAETHSHPEFQIHSYLEFSPGNLTTLVGPNNAGKSNILGALNWLLGQRYPMARYLEDKDFFNRQRGQELSVQVWFEPNPHSLDSTWFCIADDDKNTGMWCQKSVGGRPFRANDELRQLFPLVYLDANRNYERAFSTSQWSLFGQAIRRLHEYFQDPVGADVQRALEGHLGRAQQLLKTPLYESFVKAVAEGFQAQLQQTAYSVKVDFRNFDPLSFYRNLQPLLIEDGDRKDAGEAGSGMRNLLVMALFQGYARTFRGKAVIAVEEPEMYMHPHAQRSLAALFRENGGPRLTGAVINS